MQISSFIYVVCLLCVSGVSVSAFVKTSSSIVFRNYQHHTVSMLAAKSPRNKVVDTIVAACLLWPVVSHAAPAFAMEQQYKLPPIDRADLNRCKLQSSSIGQANAARDKLYDLRECDLKGQDASGKDQSGMIASEADFTGVSFKEGQISKAYARNSKFVSCDFTNAVVDRVSFDGSDMKKSIFANAVLSGTTFSGADLKDTDFTDAYLGPFDLKNLCSNPSLAGTNPVTGRETRESVGCFDK